MRLLDHMHPQNTSPTNDPLFPALSKSIRDGDCVVVLGAGISQPDYPTWDGLIDRLKVDCQLAPDELNGTGYLDVAEAAKRKGRTYFDALDSIFEERDNLQCQMRYHRLARVQFASYVTLNFDSVLLRTFALHQNITVSEFPNLADGHHGNQEIFHIHGRLGSDRPAARSKVVLSRSDFESAYDPFQHRLHSFLQSTFLDHDVCFLGCNPAEQNMVNLLAACEKFCKATHGLSDGRKPHWYLLWDDETNDPEGLEGTGIKLVRYPRKGSGYMGMDEILEIWGDIKRPSFRAPGVQRTIYRADAEPGQ